MREARRTIARLEAALERRAAAELKILTRKKELRALTANLGLAEERERRRIAAGLHDDVGHTLALAKASLGQLLRTEQPADAADTISDLDGLLDSVIRTTRSLTFELSSPVLYELGLESALENLGEVTGRRHDVRFHFDAGHSPPSVADDLALLLYRIVRELINNVVKHARARSVALRVRTSANEIRITVKDDGVGFNATAAGDGFGPGGKFGLFSIRQQLHHIGGRLEIESSSGAGTRVVVFAPIVLLGEDVR